MVGSGSGSGKFDRIRIRKKGPDPQHWAQRCSSSSCPQGRPQLSSLPGGRAVQGPLLVDNYAGPYLVLEKGPKVFKLQLGERTEVVSRDRLKPHTGQVPQRPLRDALESGLGLSQDFARSQWSNVTVT